MTAKLARNGRRRPAKTGRNPSRRLTGRGTARDLLALLPGQRKTAPPPLGWSDTPYARIFR